MTEQATAPQPMSSSLPTGGEPGVAEEKVSYRQIRPSGVKLIPPPSFGMIEDQLYR